MAGKTKDLGTLSLGELAGVIGEYPWFGAARRELCSRMLREGGNDWGIMQYADAAMYIPSREIIAGMVLSARREESAAKDAGAVIKEYISPRSQASSAHGPDSPGEDSPAVQPSSGKPSSALYRRTVTPVGGDFFSKEEYASVTRESDKVFSRFKAVRFEGDEQAKWNDPELGFCTETLGRIYAEQGYLAEAEKIYSRLMLRYPEKSAYFASLIRNLDPEN